ncbi:FIG004453: protein YceG like [methanotrophic endosymbiont of Bathymodiolus azoricus (Menez Gwen)]|nr:FIG004453: protein YceG like [methanotrophic endosymbiont of Bathymodiolus azoricus (Menez Gwen)]
MPGIASIDAAAHPAKTKYLYFVSKGNGKSHFSNNLKAHNRAVKKYILR